MTTSKEVTWYKNHYAVTWEDGTTEDVLSHDKRSRDMPKMRGPRVYLARLDSIDAQAVGYIRPWKRSKKVKTTINVSAERVLNFEKIESIDHIGSEAVTAVVEVDE